VNARISAGDAQVHFVDTSDWLTVGDYVDGAHPTDGAHLKIAEKLSAVLRPYLDSNLVSGGGGYRVIASRNSGKLLDVSGASTADGAAVIQWPDNGGGNQRWAFLDAGGGYWNLVNRNSGKCLDVPAGSTADGIQLVQWTCNGGTNQQWKQIWNGSYFQLQALHSGKCADVSGASTADGAKIIQWPCHDGANQQWTDTG
jgi:hypothetical protein